MVAKYDSRSVTITAVSTSYTRVLGGNGNRVSLAISCGGTIATNVALQVSTSAVQQYQWLSLTANDTKVFPYRDIGPLVKEPVFVRAFSGTMPVTITEVVKLPNMG